MEHGSADDASASTFSLTDEDHTLANTLRFSLNQESLSLISKHFYHAYVFFLYNPGVFDCLAHISF